jgi:hypothetical protein
MSGWMDLDKVHETLADAISLQAQSVLTMAVMAGTVRGVGGAAIKQSLREFVLAELADSYQLIEKLSALGGRVVIDTPVIDVSTDAGPALRSLLEHEVGPVSGPCPPSTASSRTRGRRHEARPSSTCSSTSSCASSSRSTTSGTPARSMSPSAQAARSPHGRRQGGTRTRPRPRRVPCDEGLTRYRRAHRGRPRPPRPRPGRSGAAR